MLDRIIRVHKKHRLTLYIMALAAIVGIIASLVLSAESIELARNADVKLACSLNAALDCAAVGLHPTAHILGFPNAFIGLMTLPVMLTIAIALLMGAKMPRNFMFIAQIGAIGGVLFALWMYLVSFTVIRVMCPWCLTTDLAMLAMFIALLRYNVIEGNLYLRKKADAAMRKFVQQGYDVLVGVAIVMLAAVSLILQYGQSLFG